MSKWFLFLLFPYALFGIENEPRSFLRKLWGDPPKPVIYLGMWTYHFRDHDGSCNWNNHAYGIEYNGYFVSSMVNTYHQQCGTIGITRDYFQRRLTKNIGISLGYRFGGIYGYDSKLKSISDFAEKYKILPYGQIYTHIIIKRVRFEISYINQLVSFHLSLLLKDF